MIVDRRDALALAAFFLRAPSPIVVCGHDGTDPDSFASAVVIAFLASLFNRAATALIHPVGQRWLAALLPAACHLDISIEFGAIDVNEASLVLVDAQSTARARAQLGERRIIPDVVIDHHAPEIVEAKELTIMRDASSTSEIIALMIKAMIDGDLLDARQKLEIQLRFVEIATLLVAGIHSDTQGMSMYVGPETTSAYAWLMDAASEIVGRECMLDRHRAAIDSIQHRFTVDEYLMTMMLMRDVIIDSSAKTWAVVAKATESRDIDATYDLLRRLSYQTRIDDICRYIVVAYNEREARVGIRADDGTALAAAQLLGGGGRAYAAGARIALSGDETPRSVVFRLCSFLRGI